jgi:hypothetical protein
MTHSKQDLDHLLLEEFVKDLEATTLQVQSLLQDIRESEVEFATIKTELRIFIEHVKELSSIIREGDGGSSLLTRIALVEKSVTEIEAWVKTTNQKKDTQSTTAHTTLQVADKTGRWQLMTAIATGVLALITSTITLLFNLLGKH